MMLEGSVAEDFSHMKNRKTCCILHIHEYHVHKKKMIQQEKLKEAYCNHYWNLEDRKIVRLSS